VPAGEAGLTIPSAGSRANKLFGFDASGLPSAVAASASDLATIAEIAPQITLVAANITPIGVVATDLAGANTIGTVATNIASVGTVSTNIANVNLVGSDLALGAGSFILAAPGAAITATTQANLAIAAAANVGTSVAREPDEFAALSGSLWTKQIFQASSSTANAPGANGEIWMGFDAGTDLTVGVILDALEAAVSIGATATQIVVKVWKVATADGSVNSGPPQTNDVLVSSVTFGTLSAIEAFDGGANGVTPNTAERDYVFPLQAPIIVETAKTYKVSFNALDVSNAAVAINMGTRTVTATGRQRRNGGSRNPVGAGSFTNTATTLIRTIGWLTRKLNLSSDAAASVATNTSALSAISQTRLAWANQENDRALEAQSALYSRVMPDNVTCSGDSLQATTGSSTAPADVVSDYLAPTATFTGSIAATTLTVTGSPVGTIETGSIVTGAAAGTRITGYGTGTGGTGTYTVGVSQTLGSTTLTTNAGTVAVGGTRTDQIATTFLALPAAQQNDYGISNGGTNDITQAASSVMSLTIANAGSGGTDGTFALAFSGGTGSNLVAPTGTFTVSGGAVTATSLTTRGGGYATAPTISLAASSGLTGASVTANLDIVGSIQYNIGRLMTAAGANRVVMSPWQANGGGTKTFAQARRVAAWEKATYAEKAFDALPFWAKWSNGTESDLDLVRKGYVPPSLTAEGSPNPLHPSDNGVAIEGRELARIIRATAGIGAPYIHDDLVGAKNGDALATAIVTPRYIGTPKGFQIVDGNPADAVRIDGTTGAITRGAGALPAISELYVQADSVRKGRSNIARITVVRQAGGTTPSNAVRIKGNGAAVLTTDKLTGGVGSKKMSYVVVARFNDTASGTILSAGTTGTSAQLGKNGKTLRATLTNAAGTAMVNMFHPTAVDPYDWNVYFGCLDTTTGVRILNVGTNEITPVTATPTADALYPFDTMASLFYSSGLYINNFDIKLFWQAADYLDFTDPAVRALFYNPTTRAPLDLGAAGTISGVTPLIYLRGMAGDYMLGKNFGTGGDFFLPPYVNAANVGFTDLAS
jgi:hypothetical protein